jgi:hypothetical protein
MESIEVLVVFILGIVLGAGIMRYAMGFSKKLIYQIKTDLPAEQLGTPIEQDFTGEGEEEV